jgi:hypothetical protein
MNDSQHKISLADALHMKADELEALDIETLQDLERQADWAVYQAGRHLDAIQNVMELKLQNELKR